MATDDSEPLIQSPEVKLEHVRFWDPGNDCLGRGKKAASARGYNAERLAHASLHSYKPITLISDDSCYDTVAFTTDDSLVRVEIKSCINKYPSGQYGRFRIWKRNHDGLIDKINDIHVDESVDELSAIYYFVVYRIKVEHELEVGKMAVPLEVVDSLIDSWSVIDHSTMGKCEYKDISWNHLLTQLNISREEFKSADAIDLTSGKHIL